MSRDIDHIIEQVSQRLPGVKVQQHWVKNPKVDDDGIWWFYLPGFKKDIRIESSNGMCPFMVEHDDMKSTSEAEFAVTIEDAVEMVTAYLTRLKGEMLR
jgi:hypothetical protein